MLGNLKRWRAGSHVTRFHTVRTIRQQTVGEHSHGVALLVIAVYPEASANLLKAALCHDLAEAFTGDTPATAKWASPQLTEALEALERQFIRDYGLHHELSELEAKVLKWADMAELVLYGMEEYLMGNRYAAEFINNGISYLTSMGEVTERSALLLNKIKLDWRFVDGS